MMDRQELIEAMSPVYRLSEEEFNRTPTSELEARYRRFVDRGAITPHPSDEVAAMKQQAREIARQVAEREKKELLKQAQQIQLGIVTDAMFRPNQIIPGKTLVDNQAIREQLISWVNPGEQINNPVLWLRKVLADNPKLIETLPFEKVVTTQEQKQQDQQAHQKDRFVFANFCISTKRISWSDANFQTVIRFLGSPLRDEELRLMIIELPSGPTILSEDGTEVALAAPSRAELIEYEQQALAKDQAHLRDLRDTDNIAALRARARADQTRNTKTLNQLQFEYSLLKTFGERDSMLPPLPETWAGQSLNSDFIRNASPDVFRQIKNRHGWSQMNARLNNLPSDFFKNWTTKLIQIEQEIQSVAGIRS